MLLIFIKKDLNMKIIILMSLLWLPFIGLTQPGVCNFTSGTSWGGGTNCGCSWNTVDGLGNTIVNCAWGNCGVPNQNECQGDCGGTYFFSSDASVECSIILPVTLVNFSGKLIDGDNNITWTTASEINSSHYLLSHSIDGKTFTTIVSLPGAGNSSEILNYNTTHLNPEKTINYYKLTQVDFDGVYEEFTVITIDNRKNPRKIIRKVNYLGQDVDEFYKGLIIIQYGDGTTERIYN